MKLVIDIDDKTYKMIKNSTFFIENDKAFVAIRDGKPFSSVIDEIKAEINYVGAHSDYGIQCVYATAVAIIDKHMERIIQNDTKNKIRNESIR